MTPSPKGSARRRAYWQSERCACFCALKCILQDGPHPGNSCPQVYAGLLSRGPPASSTESLPADEASSLVGVEAPCVNMAAAERAAERDELAAAAPQQLEEPEPAPAAWEAAATNLPALDECLTPLAAQTLPGPGLGGRRVSRLGR